MNDLKRLTAEELIKLATSQIVEEDSLAKYANLPHVQQFINSEGIKTGDYKVPATLVYDRYLTWTKLHDLKPKVKQMFFREFKVYFNRKISNGYSYYFLSTDGFNLSAEYLELLKQKRAPRGKKKKTNKVTE